MDGTHATGVRGIERETAAANEDGAVQEVRN